MRKRLRKKLNLGEFKETGFELTWKFIQEPEELDLDKFIDDFLAAIENRGLAFGGVFSVDDSWQGIIASSKRYSCPDASDKEFVSDWFKSRTDIKDFFISHDIDLWYQCECCSD